MLVNLQSMTHPTNPQKTPKTPKAQQTQQQAGQGLAGQDKPADNADRAGQPDQERILRMMATAQVQLRSLAPTFIPLAAAFEDAGHDLYLVGGSVRDALLGELGMDLDFTTDARPDAVTNILNTCTDNVWDTGIDYGTVSASRNGWQIEITTFRADQYDGVSRNPIVQFGDTLEGDLVRRDFTVNAMAVRLHGDGTQDFCDPLGGINDLEMGVLDTPQTPSVSFHDDPLRMIRACRFVSKLGFTLAPRVTAAITEMSGEITRITAERIQAELDKLMLGAYPWDGIDLLCQTGLADHIFPEIPAMAMPPDPKLPHKDVYTHSLTVLKQACDLEPGDPDLVLRWAALLHDIGKAPTRAPKPGGGVTFYQHEIVGARMVRKRLRALKYSRQMINDISQLVYLHLRIHGYGDGEWTDSAVRRYVTDAGPLLDRLNLLVRADCTTAREWKRKQQQALVDNLEARIAELREKEDLEAIRPDLDGNEIMQILGLNPGPEVGKAWAYLKNLRIEQGPMEHDEAVAALQNWWAGHAGSTERAGSVERTGSAERQEE